GATNNVEGAVHDDVALEVSGPAVWRAPADADPRVRVALDTGPVLGPPRHADGRAARASRIALDRVRRRHGRQSYPLGGLGNDTIPTMGTATYAGEALLGEPL